MQHVHHIVLHAVQELLSVGFQLIDQLDAARTQHRLQPALDVTFFSLVIQRRHLVRCADHYQNAQRQLDGQRQARVIHRQVAADGIGIIDSQEITLAVEQLPGQVHQRGRFEVQSKAQDFGLRAGNASALREEVADVLRHDRAEELLAKLDQVDVRQVAALPQVLEPRGQVAYVNV